MKIDISILEKIPELDTKAKLIIQPLAPLSMVNDFPGAYYKSLKSPTKKMLCGLLENIMGWHLDVSDRIQIEKDLEAIRKKQKVEFQSAKEGSTYIPLLMEYFEIETTIIPDGFAYSDLWSRAFRRGDADVHPKGTPNISFELIPKKSGVEIIDLYKANIGGFPMYYSTPTHREYFVINDSIEIIINCDSNIIKTLEKGIEDNNIAYLGNSEGWIHLEVEAYE